MVQCRRWHQQLHIKKVKGSIHIIHNLKAFGMAYNEALCLTPPNYKRQVKQIEKVGESIDTAEMAKNITKQQSIIRQNKAVTFCAQFWVICYFFYKNSYYMNKTYILLGALLTVATVLYTYHPQSVSAETSQYLAYLSKYSKPIPNTDQLTYRTKLFAEFVKTMQKHNSDPSQTWEMGINQFSDLTKEEFSARYLGEMSMEIKETNEPINAGFTVEVDWRTKGVVTKVKNQGQCGSCWAFGATAAHESYQIQFKSQSNSIDLSEQQLVDCSHISPYQNNGCNGGYAIRALEYIKDFGQTTQENYPYVAKTGTECKVQGGSFRPFGSAEGHGCEEIEQIIVRRPMAVRVDASNWSPYRSGIFSNCNKSINHAVFMVGSSETAWTIKNSWGPTWGESGYIRLAKGDTCAVCQGPAFAI